MNKRGFTLVEIIAVIVILGLLIMLVAPSFLNLGDASKKKILEKKIQSIELSAANWAQSNDVNLTWTPGTCSVKEITGATTSSMTTIACETYTINVQRLIDDKFLTVDDNNGKVINPTDKTQALNTKNIIIRKYFNSYYADYQE